MTCHLGLFFISRADNCQSANRILPSHQDDTNLLLGISLYFAILFSPYSLRGNHGPIICAIHSASSPHVVWFVRCVIASWQLRWRGRMRHLQQQFDDAQGDGHARSMEPGDSWPTRIARFAVGAQRRQCQMRRLRLRKSREGAILRPQKTSETALYEHRIRLSVVISN